MKIGMLADLYKPYVSGVTNHIALTKKYLEKTGHEVFVFTFGDEDYQDEEPNVIRSTGLPVTMPVMDVNVVLNVRYRRKAQELLHQMDVIHVHHPILSVDLALRYARPRGIPIVFTNHTRYDLYYQAYLPWMPEALGEIVLRSYLPSLCKSLDMVIAPSPGLYSVMKYLGVHTPVEVVPNGVDLKPIQAVKKPFDRAEFGIPEGDLIFTYVGRIGVEKNLPFLLRSFGGVAEAYDHVHLVIVGDGPEFDNLVDRVKHMGLDQRVHFTGLVPYEQLPEYLTMADVFVTASVTEVHPLTVIEAMAAGLPVLGIYSPGVGDMVEEEETGLLANEDLAAYTAKMTRLVTDHQARQRMSKNAVEVSKNYAIERTSQKLVEKYEEVIENKKLGRKPWYQDLVLLFDKIRS